jgi:hypothetical protein
MIFEFKCGLIPFIIFNVVMALSAIVNIIFASIAVVHSAPTYQYGALFGFAGFQLLLIYMSFVLPAFITVLRDHERLSLTTKNKIIGVLTYAIYFYTFVTAFLDGFFHPKKKTTWSKVEHTGEVTNKNIK